MSFTNNTGGDCVGGITGYHSGYNSEIYDCINEANITFMGGYGAGGIIGRMFSGKVESCINKGNVIGYENGHYGVRATGGIVGNAFIQNEDEEQQTRTIIRCTNQGQITGKAGVTGGIVGAIAGAESIVEECVYEGIVNGEEGSEANAIGEDYR